MNPNFPGWETANEALYFLIEKFFGPSFEEYKTDSNLNGLSVFWINPKVAEVIPEEHQDTFIKLYNEWVDRIDQETGINSLKEEVCDNMTVEEGSLLLKTKYQELIDNYRSNSGHTIKESLFLALGAPLKPIKDFRESA